MLLKIPADGWYIVWYHMNIAPGTKLVVTNYATKLAEFSGDGTWKSYPTLLEMEDGYVYITACTPDIAQNVSYFMSGAYDIP